MAEGEHYSYFSIVLNNRPIVLNPKSHPDILIEVILIKQKACTSAFLAQKTVFNFEIFNQIVLKTIWK